MNGTPMGLPVIKTLWIGDSLGRVEQLALKSFIAHGHIVELFSYDSIDGVPSDIVQRDASEIIPPQHLFKYKRFNSYSGFSNWFRYKMLYQEGGIWVDTDVICLKPFEFDLSLIAGWESFQKVNGAVLGGCKGDPLFAFLANQCEQPNQFLPYDFGRIKLKKLRRRFLEGNARNNIDWGETGPVGLTRALRHFNRLDEILPTTAFYPIHWECFHTFYDTTYPTPERYFPDSWALHLWNEMLRRNPSIDKEADHSANSLFEELKRRYL